MGPCKAQRSELSRDALKHRDGRRFESRLGHLFKSNLFNPTAAKRALRQTLCVVDRTTPITKESLERNLVAREWIRAPVEDALKSKLAHAAIVLKRFCALWVRKSCRCSLIRWGRHALILFDNVGPPILQLREGIHWPT